MMNPSRSIMYVDDCYPRTLPSSPYERGFRSSPMELPSAFAHHHSHDHMRPESGIYTLPVGAPPPPPGFSGSGRSSPPYPSHYVLDSFSSSSSKYGREEVVRKTNLYVQLANGQISHTSRYGQIQPKMCRDGRFPSDFRSARTVEEMKVMDPSTLDRILMAYQLPTDLRSLRLTSRDPISSRTAAQAKLITLLDFLGATQLAEYERFKKSAVIGY